MKLVVTRNGVPCPDQKAALEEFKTRCAAPPHLPVGQIKMPNIGLGILRASGAYIGLILQMERPGDRVDILGDVMEKLGIPIEDLADFFQRKTCKRCGMRTTPLYPCECGEAQP